LLLAAAQFRSGRGGEVPPIGRRPLALTSAVITVRLLRGLLAVLVWLLALVLLLVAVLLCATLILLPLGIPLLRYALRLFGGGLRLTTSRKVTHPVDELHKAVSHSD
jgi:uncharacterized RDD family membrane protein YckC